MEIRETRAQTRRETAVMAQCLIGQYHGLIGTIRDLTSDGAFFEPEAGFVDGWFSSNQDMEEVVEVGDSVTLIFPGPAGADREVTAIVRWLGASRQHNCSGFGVEFEIAMQQAA